MPLQLDPILRNKLLTSAALFFIIGLLRFVLVRYLVHRIQDLRAQYKWRKAVTYVAYLVVFLAVGRVWFQGIESLSTFLGLMTAGLAVALQDPIVNLAGWMFLMWRRPFEVGDRIQIGELSGDVVDIRIFQFTVLEIGNWVAADQSTGRIVHVPNGKVFREHVANSSTGFDFIWTEIPVLVTFESDWKKAKQILSEIGASCASQRTPEVERQIKEAAQRYLIFYKKLTPIVYTSIRDSGVLLTLRFLCETRRRRAGEQEIWEQILDRFAAHADIDFAYPTQRFFDNSVEGKPEARAAK